MKGVVMKGVMDALSSNETSYHMLYFKRDVAKEEHIPSIQLALESAEILKKNLKHTRIDLHISNFSTSLLEGEEIIVPMFNVSAKRVIRAGDAWNTGSIYAELVRFKHDERLLSANIVAGFHISNEEGRHLTKAELLKFLEKTKLKPYEGGWNS